MCLLHILEESQCGHKVTGSQTNRQRSGSWAEDQLLVTQHLLPGHEKNDNKINL